MSFLNNKTIVCVLAFFISLALLSWLQAGPTFADPDSFYHARVVQLMADQGVVQDFPWLSQTVLVDYYTDHHFLFHLIILPLTYFFEAAIAIKIGTVFLGAVLVSFLAWYLMKKQVKYAWAYILVLLTIAPFLTRLSLAKASSLALLLLFLGIYFIEKKKYLYLFLIAFLYVWAHGGFVLLLLVALILAFRSNLKNYLLIIASIIGGFIAGLVINPYFPKNLYFYWQQVIQIGLVNYKDKFEVGAEWYAYGLQDLLGATNLVWILIVIAVAIFVFYFKKQNISRWQWAVLMLVFLIATLRSRRFVEYFVPIAFVWTAFTINWFLNSEYWPKLFSKYKKSLAKHKFWHYVLIIYFLIVIPFGIGQSIMATKKGLDNGFAFNHFQGASNYLKNNSEPGEVVWHGKWDDWPILFYHNQHNYYLVGLDATFMYKYDKELFELWRDVANGYVREDLSKIIKQKFNSRYIFIDNKEEDTKLLHAYLQRNENIELVYEDDIASVYKIK